MSFLIDRLTTFFLGTVVVTVCEAVADAIDPVGAYAWEDLTDSRIAAFIAETPRT